MFNLRVCNAATVWYSQLKFGHMHLCGMDYKYFSTHCCKCNSFGCTAAIRCGNACHGPHSDSLYSGSEHSQFNSPRLVKREAGFPNPRRALIGSNQLWRVNDSPYYREYLDDIPRHIHRRALTALRISAHKLEIEVGRYSREYTPRQNRFCTLCNNAGSAQTGDEFHAIMHCPSFAAQRENLRDKVAGHAPLFNQLNEYEQFIFLLTCEGAPACHMGEFSYNVLSAVRKPVWGLNLINTCLSVYDVCSVIWWFSLSFCCYIS